MARAMTAGELIKLRKDGQSSKMYLAVLSPASVFTARVHGTPASLDKLAEVVFDGGSGGHANAIPGQTVYFGTSAGAYDIGMARLRAVLPGTSGTMKIGEASELDIADNQYITVVDEFAPWAKHTVIDSGGNVFMDFDVVYSDQHQYTPPVVVMGPSAVAWLQSGTKDITFDATDSFSVGSGGSATYLWSASAGSWDDNTSGTPTLTVSATGTVRVSCQVTWDYGGGNSAVATGYRYCFVYDRECTPQVLPTTYFQLASCSGDWGSGGWSFKITMYDEALRTEIRDRTLIVLFAEDWYGNTDADEGSIGPISDRENVIAVGWVAGESISYNPELGRVTFTVQGPHWWLNQIPGFPAAIDDYDGTPTTWLQFEDLTVDKGLWHVLQYCSTVTLFTDVQLSSDTRQMSAFDAPPGKLWTQITASAESTILAHPCCDRYGRLYIEVDSQFLPVADRASIPVVQTIETQDWRDDVIVERRTISNAAHVDLSGVNYVDGAATALFSLSPGHVPKRYGGYDTRERLALTDQAQSNTLAGLVLGWLNNEFPNTTVPLASNHRGFDVCPKQYAEMSVVSGDTERGFVWSSKKLIPRRVSFRHNPKTGAFLTDIEVEGYTTPELAVDGDIPATPPAAPDPPAPPLPIEPGPDPWPEGSIKACIAWTKDQVAVTDDIWKHHVSNTTTIGTTGIDLYDTATNFTTAEVAVGDIVENLTAGANLYEVTTIATIESDNHLTLTADIGFGVGDSYHICGADWTDKSSGVVGEILQLATVYAGMTVTGVWLLTDEKLYYASNMFDPSWSEKLDIDDVIYVNAGQPGWGDGWQNAEFRGIAVWEGEPGALVVSFALPSLHGSASGFGIGLTRDLGSSWTHPSCFPTTGNNNKHYYGAPYHGITVDPSTGAIYNLRGGTSVTQGTGMWVWRCSWVPTDANDFEKGTNSVRLSTPSPDRADLFRAYSGTNLYVGTDTKVDAPVKSADGGDTWITLSAAGYFMVAKNAGGIDVGKSPSVVGWLGDPNDVLMGWQVADNGGGDFVLLSSGDGGGTWTEIGNANDLFQDWSGTASPATVCQVWPNDDGLIVYVCQRPSGASPDDDCRIRITDDGGATWFNKMGDWYGVMTDWGGESDPAQGNCGCLGLPRAGSNA